MSFLRHQGIYCVRSENNWAGGFPPRHAMSSRRLFLSGLLSSRARLRFAGTVIMANSNPRWKILSLHELIREPVQLARSALPWALSIRTLGRICPLEMPGRGLNDRVHLNGSGRNAKRVTGVVIASQPM